MFNFRNPYPDRRDPEFFNKVYHKDTTREHFSNLGEIFKEEGPFWALHYDLSKSLDRGYVQKGLIGVGAIGILTGLSYGLLEGAAYLDNYIGTTDKSNSDFSTFTPAFISGIIGASLLGFSKR